MPIPSFKLTLGGTTEIVDDKAISIKNVRPENGISSLEFLISDYKSKWYTDGISMHTQVELAIKCEVKDTYTTVFSGLVHDAKPIMTNRGEMMRVECWGWGIALDKTLCNTSFGVESVHPTVDTAEEILDYLATNFVQKRLGPAGGDTNWDLDTTDVDAPHADFSITNLTANYQTNLTILNRLCDLINAHAVSDSDIGVHWYVDTDKHLRMKEIDADAVDNAWDEVYGANWTKYNFKESSRIIARNFHVQVNDYYNSIILASAWRKPASDYWTEDNGGAALWGYTWDTVTDENAAGYYVVGSDSLKMHSNAGGGGIAILGASYMTANANAGQKNVSVVSGSIFSTDQDVVIYDSTPQSESNTVASIAGNVLTMENNLANNYTTVNGGLVLIDQKLDFDYAGSENNSPKLGFYSMYGANIDTNLTYVQLHTDWFSNYVYIKYCTGDSQDKWYHKSLPVGKYWKNQEQNGPTWVTGAGTIDWSDIKHISFMSTNAAPGGASNLYLDDLHFSGHVVRHAYDASLINATTKERQLLIRLDTALDDTLNTTDNTGTAALLATAELYKRTTTPVVGTLEFELKEDMLPGQKIQVWAGKQIDGTYRWSDQTMRIRKLTHTIDNRGFKTTVEVTSDVTNCNTRGLADQYSLLMEHAGALGHGEAKDLKASGIDPLIPRLAWDPT